MASESTLEPAGAVAEAWARAALPPPAVCRDIRLGAGLSLRRVARDLGVTGAAVAMWETGARRPSGARLVGYASLLADLAEITSRRDSK